MSLTNKTTLICSTLFGMASIATGFLWYIYKQKSIKDKPSINTSRKTDASSTVTVVLTQTSDEGRAVTVLHNSAETVCSKKDVNEPRSNNPLDTPASDIGSISKSNSDSSSGVSDRDHVIDDIVVCENASVCQSKPEDLVVESDCGAENNLIRDIKIQDLSLSQNELTGQSHQVDVTSCQSFQVSDALNDSPHRQSNDNSIENDVPHAKTVKASDSGVLSDAPGAASVSEAETDLRSVEIEAVEQSDDNAVPQVDDSTQPSEVEPIEQKSSSAASPVASDTSVVDATASQEQCQSSDSGVSIQSEAEPTEASGKSPEDETEAEAGALVTSNNNERKKSDRAAAADEIDLFEFDFPSDLCGMLIGNKGKNIKRLMESSGAKVTVRKKPYSPSLQVIAVQGFPNQISHVMHQIRQRFPPRRYGISYAPSVPEKPMLSPEIMQLHLPEGVHVDVVITAVVTANHVFVHQPTHPSYHLLQRLTDQMTLCYNHDQTVPELPRPIEAGVICAAPMFDGWYRIQVMQSYPETDECDVRYVDYGGFAKVQASEIRQIRSDFTQLPFQAAQCFLANVIPAQGKNEFSLEDNAVLEQMVQGRFLQAEVLSRESNGVPYINLYLVDNSQVFLINRELVNKGVARWCESQM